MTVVHKLPQTIIITATQQSLLQLQPELLHELLVALQQPMQLQLTALQTETSNWPC
jgi:hypothetical protein